MYVTQRGPAVELLAVWLSIYFCQRFGFNGKLQIVCRYLECT